MSGRVLGMGYLSRLTVPRSPASETMTPLHNCEKYAQDKTAIVVAPTIAVTRGFAENEKIAIKASIHLSFIRSSFAQEHE